VSNILREIAMSMNVKCSVCNSYFRQRDYCREDGNQAANPVNPTDDGINYLVHAYRVVDATHKDPTGSDYEESRRWFERALQYEESFPPVLRMVSWFQYAMRIVQMVGGGPLRKVESDDLQEFVRALELAQQILNTLSAEIKRTIQVNDPYDHMIRSNLNEARKVLNGRR
jgi:hypothetical protein